MANTIISNVMCNTVMCLMCGNAMTNVIMIYSILFYW